MKIPRFQHSGVPGAEQQSVGAIVQSGRARMNGNLNALNKVVQDFGSQVLKAEQDAEYHRLTRGLNNDAQLLWSELEQKEQFDQNEAPLYDTLLPEFEKGFKKMRSDYESQSKFRQNGQALTEVFDSLHDKYSSHVRSVVRGRQVDYLKGEVIKQLDGLDANIETGMAEAKDIMDAALVGGIWSPEQYEKETLAFTSKHHENRIKTEFQTARDNGYGPEYAENIVYPESFSQSDKDAYGNYMRVMLDRDQAEIDADDRQVKAELKLKQKTLTDEAKRYQESIESGAILTDTFVDSYVGIVNQIIDPSDKADFERTLRWYADGQAQLHSETGHTLQDLIANRDTLQGHTVHTIDDAERRDAILKTLNSAINKIEADPQQAAIDMGLIAPRKATLQDAINSNNIVEWLQESGIRKAQVADYWGVNAQLINDDDMDVLADHLNTSNGIAMLGNIVETMGSDAHNFLAEALDKGYGVMAVMGDMHTQADAKPGLGYVLAGRAISESEGGLGLYEVDNDLAKSEFDDYVGTGTGSDSLYQDDWRIRKGVFTSVNLAYAAMMANSGDTSGEFDEKVYQKAMGSVIGYVYKRKGQRIISARRDMNESAMNRWTNNIKKEQLIGLPDEPGAELIAKEVREGVLDLVNTGDQGKFMLARNGALFVKDENGNDFVLEYK